MLMECIHQLLQKYCMLTISTKLIAQWEIESMEAPTRENVSRKLGMCIPNESGSASKISGIYSSLREDMQLTEDCTKQCSLVSPCQGSTLGLFSSFPPHTQHGWTDRQPKEYWQSTQTWKLVQQKTLWKKIIRVFARLDWNTERSPNRHVVWSLQLPHRIIIVASDFQRRLPQNTVCVRRHPLLHRVIKSITARHILVSRWVKYRSLLETAQQPVCETNQIINPPDNWNDSTKSYESYNDYSAASCISAGHTAAAIPLCPWRSWHQHLRSSSPQPCLRPAALVCPAWNSGHHTGRQRRSYS